MVCNLKEIKAQESKLSARAWPFLKEPRIVDRELQQQRLGDNRPLLPASTSSPVLSLLAPSLVFLADHSKRRHLGHCDLGAIQVAHKIPLDDPEVLLYACSDHCSQFG